MFKKIVVISLFLLVGIMAMSSASALFGIGEGDLVEVVSVGIYDDYSGGNFGGAVDSSIAAREDEAELASYANSGPTVEQWGEFEVVTDYGSSNQAEMDMVSTSDSNSGSSKSQYDIGLGLLINLKAKDTKKDLEEITLKNLEVKYQDGSVQKLDNFTFECDGGIVKDDNISLPCQFKLDQSLWNESIKLKDFYGNAHVKGDIYAKINGESNKLIGHIDNDVSETG